MKASKKKSQDHDEMPEIELGSGRFRRVGRGRHAGEPLPATLQTLRDMRRLTQVSVSKESGIAQGDVSKLESRESLDDVQVSTLKRFVEALGGELRLVADFGSHRYAIAPAPDHVETTAAMLRAKREAAGLTTEQVAERMGVHPASSIAKLERGTEELSARFVQKYLAALERR